MRFVWHDMDELPDVAFPVIIKTNYVGTYYIGVYNEGWWIKTGKRYVQLTEAKFSPNEKITGWAYIGGEE